MLTLLIGVGRAMLVSCAAMPSRRFDRFLDALSRVELSERAVNQFARGAGNDAGNAIRRANLKRYLDDLAQRQPVLLLIGEAPSYRGGRLTGIPFVSESLMLRGVCTANEKMVLGSQRGFMKADVTTRPSTEASATMVWGTICEIEPLPLLWNAFPFHPFHAGNPHSNRCPTAGELVIGQPFIASLLRLFPIERVVAIGNSASASLSRMAIDHEKVRHPSQGGKTRFVEGMARLSQRRRA